jgi:hypothetical protein
MFGQCHNAAWQCVIEQGIYSARCSEAEKSHCALLSSVITWLSPCDFFVFQKLKITFQAEYLLSANTLVQQYSRDFIIYLQILWNVLTVWIRRLNFCISLGGEYYEGTKLKWRIKFHMLKPSCTRKYTKMTKIFLNQKQSMYC